MNTNTDEWGNIELPGLTDEKLFKTNWHYVAVNREVGKTQKHRATSSKNSKESWANESIRDRRVAGLKNAWEENYDQRALVNKIVAQTDQAKEHHKKLIDRKKKKVSINGTVFESLREAARTLDIPVPTLQYRLKKFPEQYFYIT